MSSLLLWVLWLPILGVIGLILTAVMALPPWLIGLGFGAWFVHAAATHDSDCQH